MNTANNAIDMCQKALNPAAKLASLRASVNVTPTFQDDVSANDFGRRLSTLKGLTPYEYIRKNWAAGA